MNEKLNRMFTEEDIFVALKSMSPLKVSSANGLRAVFYQRFKHILGREMTRFCIEIL